jgi:hypothetical protein
MGRIHRRLFRDKSHTVCIPCSSTDKSKAVQRWHRARGRWDVLSESKSLYGARWIARTATTTFAAGNHLLLLADFVLAVGPFTEAAFHLPSRLPLLLWLGHGGHRLRHQTRLWRGWSRKRVALRALGVVPRRRRHLRQQFQIIYDLHEQRGVSNCTSSLGKSRRDATRYMSAHGASGRSCAGPDAPLFPARPAAPRRRPTPGRWAAQRAPGRLGSHGARRCRACRARRTLPGRKGRLPGRRGRASKRAGRRGRSRRGGRGRGSSKAPSSSRTLRAGSGVRGRRPGSRKAAPRAMFSSGRG